MECRDTKTKNDFLKSICKRLLEYDPDIVEIVQFGSSVYAPELAKDIDILIITRQAKENEGYLDTIFPLLRDRRLDVDVIVVEVGEKLREELLRGILGSFKVLYGDGEYILKFSKTLGDPSFEEAKSALRVAKAILELSSTIGNPLDRDRLVREAFDSLFHAARIAAMTYLSTEVSRWGLIRRMLPEPYREEFKEIINVLHIKYFYHGDYPKDSVKEEFEYWYSKVEYFVHKLEKALEKVY